VIIYTYQYYDRYNYCNKEHITHPLKKGENSSIVINGNIFPLEPIYNFFHFIPPLFFNPIVLHTEFFKTKRTPSFLINRIMKSTICKQKPRIAFIVYIFPFFYFLLHHWCFRFFIFIIITNMFTVS